MPVPGIRLAALLLLLYLAGCTPRMSGVPLPDRAGTATPAPAVPVPTFTPTPTPSPAFTPTPTPSLTVSGAYDNPAVHADGRYELQLAGTRVAATFTTSRSPVEHWARQTVPQPLFTIPEPFRPPYPIRRTVEGTPVQADGTPDPARTAPHRFLLRVEPDGTVHYVDDGRVQDAGHLAYVLHTVWDIRPPPPTSTPTPIPTSTPTSTVTPTPTFAPAVPSPTPSLTVSGTYDNRVEHADGRYELQLSGARVAATFATSRSPVQYWAREVPQPLFTVPEPFRPPYPVLRTAEGIPVRADGSPDPDHPAPRRFLLRVDPDGTVHYVDDDHVEGVGYLAYALDTIWGTIPAANDRAVLEILDRHWFGETLLSAEPPPVQFEVPAFGIIKMGTIPAAMVGAFVKFDADGRVTALGAPSDAVRVLGGAPIYTFNGPLLPELGELHHLEYLDLGYQGRFASDAKQRGSRWGPVALTGAIPPQLWQLPRLRHLDLQGQRLAGILPSDMGRLVTLEYLDLGNNWLSGPLPPEIGGLASLKHLDLGGNDFTELLSPELGQLPRLQRLDLSHNQLSSDSLPSELGDLASLDSLDLSYNRLTAVPPALGRLTRLQRLDLSHNQLSSDSLPSELGDLASLDSLDLSYNQLTALPPELGRQGSLKYLDLRGNRLTDLPPELGQLASLERLDLGDNQLTALPPEWNQLTSLLWLDLSYNQVTGSLLPEWGQLTSLEYLHLFGNQLTGFLPPEWGQLTSLEYLHLGGNQLTGPLPPEWGQLDSLQGLTLYGNRLTGSLPPEWSQLTSLEYLHLSGNQLTGFLPPQWGQLDSLDALYLAQNQLTGPLPPEWGQLASLQWLDLHGNQLTGSLPLEWVQLASLQWLERLNLRDNQLTGCVPTFANPYHSYIAHDLPNCQGVDQVVTGP